MQSGSTKITLKIKRDQNGTNGSISPDLLENTNQIPADLSSSEEEEDYKADDLENQTNGDADKQLVVYDPSTNSGGGQIEPVPDLNDSHQLVPLPKKSFAFHSTRSLPSVGAYTVQCAKCFKWRLMPTKEKYEEIRECVLEDPFFCDTALEWRPNIACKDPPDIIQDGSRLWAIDKPNIARPPPGWQRLLRIRGEGSSKFADVYYASPTGKRFRSMIEVQKFLDQHPEYAEAGVKITQFSFQTPKPLREDYVRKRPAKLTPSDPENGTPGFLEAPLVNPISWSNPDKITDLHLGQSEPISRPKKRSKKQANALTSSFLCNNEQFKVGVNEPSQSVKLEEVSQPMREVDV